jgi:CheY-like chemotaxis protein
MNFVINAAEAIGPEAPGTILVRTKVCRLDDGELRNAVVREGLRPGSYVCLEVHDTGAGMTPDTQSKIFDPFFTTKFTGRGLGLSAVIGIVRSHKGGIQVQSEVNKGSTFKVFLPATDQRVAPRDNGMHWDADEFDGVVLVIDDEDTILRTARAILEKHGFQVIVAENGHAGIDTFQRLANRISLVLLDVTMPLTSGHDVLREMRLIRRDTPVIFSSGYDEEDAVKGISTSDYSGFLQKPYTAAQLLKQVRRALTRR